MKKSSLSFASVALLPFGSLHAQITFVDAIPANLLRYDGVAFTPTTGTDVGLADDQWHHRSSGVGHGGLLYTAGEAGAEDAPILLCKITGLTPGVAYQTYGYFWNNDIGNWRLKATSNSSDLNPGVWPSADGVNQNILDGGTPLDLGDDFIDNDFHTNFSASSTRALDISDLDTDGDGFSDSGFNIPVRVSHPALSMQQATLGVAVADANGEIVIAVDDLNGEASTQKRTWFDGVGYRLADADADGMNDEWELQHGLDPTVDDSAIDTDEDGLTNLQEYLGADGVASLTENLDQSDPQLADTDGDGFNDFVEYETGSIAADATSLPRGILAQTEFNFLPWTNREAGAVIATDTPLLADSGSYGVLITPSAKDGVTLPFNNPGTPVDCLVDFRIDGTLNREINFVTGNHDKVQTGLYSQCAVRVRADGSIYYYNGQNYLQDSPAGTIVAGNTYSLRLRYDIPNNSYQIELIDRSNGGASLLAVSGLDLGTRNTNPAGLLYFGIGIQEGGAGSFSLCLDNMLVTTAPTATGASQAVIDSDSDSGSDTWELATFKTMSYLGRAEDGDGDVMDQAWEIANFGDESQGAQDNPDGDLAPNWEEYLNGTDPNVANSNAGYWQIERWENMNYYSVPELVSDRDFYGAPSNVTTLRESGTLLSSFFAGSRMRGYITVDETSEYYLWVSARASADLYLSSDETPYRKQRIAYLGADSGMSHGIRFDSGNLWDVYSSQMSRPVLLEVGKKYYLEVIGQNGHGNSAHIHVAWAKSGGVRSYIPSKNISDFIGQPGDDDDDALPDAWETQHGLNTADNGYYDIAREGERGDFDSDGLSNREEYLLGTNPTNADTDNDGLNDADEHRTYGTDPSVSDSTGELLVGNVNTSSVDGLGSSWVVTAGGVLGTTYRGSGKWNFNAPGAGHWVLQVEASLRGDLRIEEVVPVQVSVDGSEIMRPEMVFRNGQPGSLRVITPYLSAGTHELELFIDNYMARRVVEITAIKVLQPGGMDLNSNGRSDTVEAKLAGLNYINPNTVVESHVSPAFIEGRARSRAHMELRTKLEGPGSTIRRKDSYWNGKIPKIQNSIAQEMDGWLAVPGGDLSAAGGVIPTVDGPGYGRWYGSIPLQPNQATAYSAFFENGSLGATGVVVWRPINVYTAMETEVPVGSELLIGAWETETDNSRLSIVVEGETHEIRAKSALPWLFDTVGDHTVSITNLKSGNVYSLLVHVRAASLPADLVVSELRYNTVSLPSVASDMTLDSGGVIGFGSFQPLASGGSEVELVGRAPGLHRLAVRLGEGKSILDLTQVQVIGVSSALRQLSDTATPAGDGLLLIRSPLLVTNLPAGATVKITIFAGGVTFTDGTTVKTLTGADFDAAGMYTLEMLISAERLGAPCHYIEIFDANGKKIFGT